MPSEANAVDVSFKLKRKYPPEADVDDWGLTVAEQDAKVEELRAILVARGAWRDSYDIYTLLRFLRAREYEVDKALSMFLDHIQWRQENRVDHILNEFEFKEREEFLSIYPQGYHKTDKKGHPVYIQHLGRVDMSKIREITTEERMMKYHIQEYERCLDQIFPICSKLVGKQIDKSFAIMDVKGVGFYHLTREVRQMLANVTKIDQDNYPETLYHTCIINAPTAFRAIWAVVKPMLNARTQAKVEVCPKNYLPCLTEWIDVENIPEYLGGKSKGTLVDDLGPWKNPELLKQLSVDRSRRLDAQISDSAKFDNTLVCIESSAELPRNEDESMPTTSYNPGLSPIHAKANGGSAAESNDDLLIYSSKEVPPLKSNRSPLLAADIPSQGYRAQLTPTPTSTSPSSTARNKALTERIRDLEIAISHRSESLRPYIKPGALPDFKRPPRESLLSRVEVLEHGMDVLLQAQELLWRSRQQQNEKRFCCIM
eukprot:g1862.t1